MSEDDDYLYIATNNHVVADSEELTVQFDDDSVVKAEIRGTDPDDDLAVVRVKKQILEKILTQISRLLQSEILKV